MSTATLEPPTAANKDFAAELRQDVIAIRLAFRRLSSSRSFTTGEKARVAREFEADPSAVSASTRLYPAKREEISKIRKVLSTVGRDFKDRTIPYVEKGVRLLRKTELDLFVQEFDKHQTELAAALVLADLHYEEIINAQRIRIGEELFDRNAYPDKFEGSVAIEWSVFNFEPNEELLKLAPSTYRREQQRVRQQFEESIAIFEDECKNEMAKMVEKLLDKLKPAEEGEKAKVFTESTVTNLRDFFERFERLGVFSDDDMVDLVKKAKDCLGDRDMAALKKSKYARADVKKGFEEISETLETLLVDAPERAIDLSDLEDM